MRKEIVYALLACLALVAVYNSAQDKQQDSFEAWKAEYGVNWAPHEESYRRLIFQKNLAKIELHNADTTQTYKMGVNQFTPFTTEEFVQTYLSVMPGLEVPHADFEEAPAIGDVDWTTKGMVSGVKNQGQCGSCWAFSATGVMESFSLMKGQSVSLSEQQLVDCSRPQGNQGCNGGWPSSALNYVKANGITTESAYPYAAKDQTCKTQGGSFKIAGQDSFSGCASLQNGINSHPISVAVDATNWSPYKSGVFSNCKTSLNHAVLLVGVVGGAWKIKNSWGTGWGESGYIRLAGSGNTCGVCAYAGIFPQ